MNYVYARFASEKAQYAEKKFPVVFDAPISEEYSETLDSASIIVPNLYQKLDIEPYQECCLEIVSNGKTTLKHFLIDSFTESMTNVEKPIYTYTINLMSETKYLEKAQCPNLCITHSEVSGQKTITHYIELYMALYCPKIKMYDETLKVWNYKPLIAVSEAVKTKFNVPCADMSLSAPTLRQALTSLMIQKKCIPVVVNRVLGFMDLAKEPSAFTGNEGRITAERAMSSDSYVNTLVNMSDNVLDQEDSIVSESLVFRDRDNVLLKQKENLVLETRYPIYSVSKFTINAYCNTALVVNSDGGKKYRYFLDNGATYFGVTISHDGTNEILGIKSAPTVNGNTQVTGHSFNGYLDIKCYICHWETDKFVIDKTIEKRTETIDVADGSPKSVTLFNLNEEYTGSITKFSIIRATFHGTQDGSSTASTWEFFISDAYEGFSQSTIHISHVSPGMFVHPYGLPNTDAMISRSYSLVNNKALGKEGVSGGWYLSFLYKKDITPLLVENSKRSQLNVDFLAMPTSFSSLDEMSKWLYCTVGFSVGSNKIEGFSTTYTKTNGWWDTDKTYVENLFSSLQSFDGTGESLTPEAIHQTFGGVFDGFTFEGTHNELANPFFTDVQNNNFSLLFFDISYLPLNKVVMRHFKDEVNLPIEQLNTADNGISSAVMLSLNQQDTIDRLGNDVLGIHERVNSLDDLCPLPCERNGYTIFKREYKIGKNAIDVNYYASKNHIIKNYFTSIQTKYRAYEYVDYDKSVLRRESDCVHVLFSTKGYINGDDLLTTHKEFPLSLIDGIMDKRYGKKLKYSYNGFGLEHYKSECATYTTNNSVYLNFTQFDNGSEGIFIDGKYLNNKGKYASNPIGGIPQQWYAPSKRWDREIGIGFIDNIGVLIPQALYYPNSGAFENWIRVLQLQPKFDFPKEIGNRVSVVKTLGKDLTELISYTLQFDFYEDLGNIQFSRWLYLASTAIGNEMEVWGVYDIDDFNPIGYTTLPQGSSKSLRMKLVGEITEDTTHAPRQRIKLNEAPLGHNTLKFLCKGSDGLYHDMIFFKNAVLAYAPGYYISFNDTKGEKVYTDNGYCLVANKTAKKTTNATDYGRIVVE